MDYTQQQIIDKLDQIVYWLQIIDKHLAYFGAGGLFIIGVGSALFVLWFIYRIFNIFLKLY